MDFKVIEKGNSMKFPTMNSKRLTVDIVFVMPDLTQAGKMLR